MQSLSNLFIKSKREQGDNKRRQEGWREKRREERWQKERREKVSVGWSDNSDNWDYNTFII